MSVLSWILATLIPGLTAYPVILYLVGDKRAQDNGTWVDYPIYITRALIF